ncbi:MAG: DUF3147 family protein [Phycisphaerae bacterium]|nr:DUF3147 family protein [Phycisphaerae bacterium]
MLQSIIKIAISALIIVIVNELAKSKHMLLATICLSLPLTSLLALTWLYVDTGDTQKVAGLASGTFWMVVPSLVFFIILPLMLKAKFHFSISMIVSGLVTAGCYVMTHKLLSMFKD